VLLHVLLQGLEVLREALEVGAAALQELALVEAGHHEVPLDALQARD